MIKIFYEIGKILKDKYPEYYKPWEIPFNNTENKKVIVINVINGVIEGNPEIEDYKPRNIDKYLFREAKARATNIVPTFYYQVYSVEKKQKDEIIKKMDKINASIKNYKHNFIEQNELTKIPELLSELELDTKCGYLLTFKINEKYFGEYKEYQDLFFKDAFDKYKKDSNSKNKVCAVTYEESEEVWGRVNTLGFTVNDVAFCRNGFNSADSHKMFPVSPDVVKILEGTKRLLEEKLSYRFFGLEYYILPHFVAVNDDSKEEVITEFLKKSESNNFEAIGNSIINNETILHEICKDEKLSANNIYYDIFFYEKNQAQFLIKLHLSDVLPSRFAKIFHVKDRIEKIFRPIIPSFQTKDKKTISFNLNFSEIRRFFSIEKLRPYKVIFQPYFFKILEAVFYSTKLNEQTILETFLKSIRISFKDTKNKAKFSTEVKKSFAIYQFFANLNLFNYIIMENEKDNLDLTVEGFIKQHERFFKSDNFKEGVFRLGCLTGILLKKQFDKLKSEPFRKELNGLSIDEKNIQIILPKLIDKLRQYETGIPELETAVAQSLVYPCNISKTEISYTFTLGMIMQREFTNEFFRNKENKLQTINI